MTEDTIKFFEDLQWYHSLVAVKTQRAMSSLYKGLTEDAVNSAEVTRKAIGKCITALPLLAKHILHFEKNAPPSPEPRRKSGLSLTGQYLEGKLIDLTEN